MKIISREQAQAAGLVRYYTGKPCKHGHISERHTVNSTCCECNALKASRYYDNNRDMVKAKMAEIRKTDAWRKANADYLAAYRVTPEAVTARKEWFAKRYATDSVFAFAKRARNMTQEALRRRGYSKTGTRTEFLLGCTLPEFRSYIQSLFTDGMSWDNRDEWELDHIVPISTAKTYTQVVKLSHFSNLQPLWRADNRRKGARV